MTLPTTESLDPNEAQVRHGAGGPGGGARPRDLVELARPGQWHKNGLVLSAPIAGGVLTHPYGMAPAAVMTVAFVAASTAVYAVNDVRDVELDRLHPRKRDRPVASGRVGVTAALTLSAAAAITAVGLAAMLGAASLLVVAAYLTSSLSYVLRFKHVAVLDIVLVASGFALRALGGAAATHVPVSNWFLLLTLFGSVSLVVGKRSAESSAAQPVREARNLAVARPVLSQYPAPWLQQVLTLSLGGCLVAYAMWAFQYVGTEVFHPLLAASVVPFLVGVLRYGLLVSRGDGEAPERLVLADRTLVFAGAVCAGTVLTSLYLT